LALGTEFNNKKVNTKKVDGLNNQVKNKADNSLTKLDEKKPDGVEKGTGKSGEFSIIDWKGYPNRPKPDGPFRMLEGGEYQAARKAANSANRKLHRSDPSLKGKQLHEVKPVKFGGSPTNPSNKAALSPKQHAEYTKYWNRLQRDLNK